MAKATTPAKTATKSTAAPETQITDFLSSVVDSTRTLVDGLLESAGDVERTVREHPHPGGADLHEAAQREREVTVTQDDLGD